ncbi:lipoprotein [Wenjunlia tyrosinilytica]|uniref:Lipoprotein n=1 Tax=Wenjunlia tyrosinilytica TaxID=1544741 RepID=A0A917ZPF1_9ACTN|nr:lipoprotein [Wenjunlia tyrosinilytica]
MAGLAGALIAGTAGCGALPGTGASSDPIVLMTWAPQGTKGTNMAGMPAIAQVFAKEVNARGGINGRKLKIITCNEGNDSHKAADCANEAVEAKAAAVVGSYSQFGSSFMPLLETAGIPYVGGYGITTDEFSSALSYPVNGGTPALLAGNGRQLADYGCDTVSLIRPDTAAGDLMPLFLDGGLHAGRRPRAVDIKALDDATDYTPEARHSVGSDLRGHCVTAALGDRTSTFFDSYRRLEPRHTKLSSVLGSIRQSLVDATGGASGPLEGVYVTGWYPPAADPRWDPMKEAVREYGFSDQRIDTADPGAQTTWVAYTAFEEIARTIQGEAIDSDTVRQALDNRKGISTGGLTPPLSWRFEDMLPLRDHSRIVNTAVTYQVVKEGRLVALRKGFVDVHKLLEVDVEDATG